MESSLPVDGGEPLQAGSVSLAGETLLMALAAARLSLVALYFAGAASPASSEGLRAFPRSS